VFDGGRRKAVLRKHPNNAALGWSEVKAIVRPTAIERKAFFFATEWSGHHLHEHRLCSAALSTVGPDAQPKAASRHFIGLNEHKIASARLLINHYRTRSKEWFDKVKRCRGRPDRADMSHGDAAADEFWKIVDTNDVADTALLGKRPDHAGTVCGKDRPGEQALPERCVRDGPAAEQQQQHWGDLGAVVERAG